MYEVFRDEVLYNLCDLDTNTLQKISKAMDLVATKYTISKPETGLVVVGREQFLEIAATYVIVRKTEGVSDGTIEHMTRILKQFINAIMKPIEEVKPNDIKAFLYKYQKDRNISSRTLDMMRTIISTFFK